MTSNQSITDRDHLTQEAYASSVRLRQRIQLYDFQVDPIDLPAWVLDRIPVRADSSYLDVGCGPGRYLEAIQRLRPTATAVGCDLSFGMSREAKLHAPTLVGDSSFLAFVDNAFDTVIAAHMLYHVPDVVATLQELARVTRSGGFAAIILNGEQHLRSLYGVLGEAVLAAGGTDVVRAESPDRIKLQAAEPLVAKYFDSVHCSVERRDIVVSDADPVVAYIESVEATFAPSLGGVDWSAVVSKARSIVSDHISAHGHWQTSSDVGMLLARKA